MTDHDAGDNGAEPSEEVRAVFATPELRVEGPLKVTGKARYAADLYLPGMLWARFLTSPHPHARVVSVDTSAARALPGVHAVLTGEDVKGAYIGRRLMDWPVLAWERVRFIGDRVAAVAAESQEIADAAVSLIEVEYEELPAILDPDQALLDSAPVLHPDAASYTYLGGKRPPVPHPNLHGYQRVTKGANVDDVFASAPHVFEHTFHTPRQHQGHIEPRATMVWFEEEVLHVLTTNKAPFSFRAQLSAATGVPPENIVVDSAFIGGDFGGKGLSIDEFACVFLARAAGRPIKSVMTYVDELQGTNPRHSASIRVRTAVGERGKFLAHEAELIFDGGAYAAGKPGEGLVPMGGTATLAGYNVPNTQLTLKTVYTNTVLSGHMRAPGEVQALFAGESHVDMIARELNMDPIELRLLNAVREGDTGIANERFREPRAVELLEALRKETRWGQEPLPPGVGRGVALGVRHVGGGKTSVQFAVHADGTIQVLTGVPDQGGGSHTLVQRVAGATLSVDPSRIKVIYGTTAEALQDPGSGGSRVTHIVGQAARHGAATLKERLEELAAEVMGWPAGEVALRGDRFVVGGQCGEEASFEEVAERIGRGPALEVRGDYNGSAHGPDEPGDFNFVVYMAEVEVDRETGQVRVRDAAVVADVGTVINPTAHQGQIDGGFVYGLGGALMEDLPIQQGKVEVVSLGDYKMPTQADLPSLRTINLPTHIGPGPYGAKMAGEVSNSGVAPAIANAVAAAVGARITRLPITSERVLAALE